MTKQLVSQKFSYLIRVQRHPPERQDSLLHGRYDLERIVPEGLWKGVFILVEADNSQGAYRAICYSLYSA